MNSGLLQNGGILQYVLRLAAGATSGLAINYALCQRRRQDPAAERLRAPPALRPDTQPIRDRCSLSPRMTITVFPAIAAVSIFGMAGG